MKGYRSDIGYRSNNTPLNDWNMEKLDGEKIVGALGLLAFVLIKGGMQPLERDWVALLILLAVLLLLPVAIRQMGGWGSAMMRWSYGLAAWGLLLAYCWEPGIVAACLALPLLLFSLWALGRALQTWMLAAQTLADNARFAAYLFWPVGTLAAFSDRLGWAPLGFSPIIILLTAAHFHYAGFLLPWVLSNIARSKPADFLQKLITYGVFMGIPAVAVGITASNFGAHPLLETLAATLMALGGLGLALWHGWLAFSINIPMLTRLGYLGLCLCLSAGMILALLYGWRYYFPLPFLSIPWMYALHGSLNTLGVGVLGVLLWGNNRHPEFLKNQNRA